MSNLTFSGLASGLDTAAIIDSLMAVEARPIARLQGDKAYQQARYTAAQTFNSKLNALSGALDNLDSTEDIQAKKASTSSSEFFTATADVDASVGSYGIEVHSLATAEKQYTQGVSDKDAQDFGTGTITIDFGGGDSTDITINNTNNSLQGIADAINAKDAGVTATIVNDGTASPYRIILTADEAAKSFTVTEDFAGGTENDLTMTMSDPASQAHIVIDGLNIYSDTNIFTEAIPNVTINLNKADDGASKEETTLTVAEDTLTFKAKIGTFVNAYNDLMSYVHSQSVSETSQGGILLGDSGVNSIKSKLQRILTNRNNDIEGKYDSLSSIGIKTESDGTLAVDDATLTTAIEESGDHLEGLLIGSDGNSGVLSGFTTFLDSVTDPIDGFLSGRKKSYEATIDRIDASIERMNMRLEQRRANLTNQFTNLEEIVSAMNAQANYLTQQMNLLNQQLSGSNK